jgi:hypothetical protein
MDTRGAFALRAMPIFVALDLIPPKQKRKSNMIGAASARSYEAVGALSSAHRTPSGSCAMTVK